MKRLSILTIICFNVLYAHSFSNEFLSDIFPSSYRILNEDFSTFALDCDTLNYTTFEFFLEPTEEELEKLYDSMDDPENTEGGGTVIPTVPTPIGDAVPFVFLLGIVYSLFCRYRVMNKMGTKI